MISHNNNARSRAARGSIKRGGALLSGLLRCGHCGGQIADAISRVDRDSVSVAGGPPPSRSRLLRDVRRAPGRSRRVGTTAPGPDAWASRRYSRRWRRCRAPAMSGFGSSAWRWIRRAMRPPRAAPIRRGGSRESPRGGGTGTALEPRADHRGGARRPPEPAATSRGAADAHGETELLALAQDLRGLWDHPHSSPACYRSACCASPCANHRHV